MLGIMCGPRNGPDALAELGAGPDRIAGLLADLEVRPWRPRPTGAEEAYLRHTARM